MDQLFALGHVQTGTKIFELVIYEVMLATLRDRQQLSRGVTSMDFSVSVRILANALKYASSSCEIPHEFRYHAKVLNDHLAEVLRSGLFDDIDHFFKMLEAHMCNRRAS